MSFTRIVPFDVCMIFPAGTNFKSFTGSILHISIGSATTHFPEIVIER